MRINSVLYGTVAKLPGFESISTMRPIARFSTLSYRPANYGHESYIEPRVCDNAKE